MRRIMASLIGLGFFPILSGVPSAGQITIEPAAEVVSGLDVQRTAEKRSIKISGITVATLDGMMEDNYARALRLCHLSLIEVPDLILLPEAFAAGYCSTNLMPYAENRHESKHLKHFRDLSKHTKIMIIIGFLEKTKEGIKSAAVIYDRGEEIGIHYKRTLFSYEKSPHRDEAPLMVAGREVNVFDTRLGRFAVLIGSENTEDANWKDVLPRVDYILSLYNCQEDPSCFNITKSRVYGKPSAWSSRTGTIYMGSHDGKHRYEPSYGSAGVVNANGEIVREGRTRAGNEQIIWGRIEF